MNDLPRKCMDVDCYNVVDESGDYKAYCEKHKDMIKKGNKKVCSCKQRENDK